ncbi:hypothetical protein EGW08_010184 [Elysia chlorotica]|uniref:PDZ domain-containing protein n=1 Tax=Elysia chlorotica TaxID=188477 RepID=A0A433TKH5_ELYCH|nr:hypothetical protein EGW08_010184 [Elysia chlorotica]
MVNAEKLVVTLTGGAPWGFRLSGGGGLPLIINKIRKKSPAHKQGLKEGDAVLAINNVRVHDKSQDQALELVEKATDSLILEIYRGDVDEIGQSKDKKPILVASQPAGDASFEATSTGFTLTATVDDVTSDAFHTPPDSVERDGGFQLTATVDDVSGSAFSNEQEPSAGSFTLTSSVEEMTSSATSHPVESSPVFLIGDAGMSTSVHSAEVEAISAAAVSPIQLAEPYYDSTVIAEHPERLSPNPPRGRSRTSKNTRSPNGPQMTTLSPVSPVQNGGSRINQSLQQQVSPKPEKFTPQNQNLSPQPQPFSPQPQAFSPQPQAFSPQPQAFSPQPQAFSPQPQAFSPRPVAPKPVTSRSPLQAWSPNRPATSPKPQGPPTSPKPKAPPTSPKPVLVPTPVVSRSIGTDNGVVTSVSTSTFDDGTTRREVSHQVQRSGDGRNNTTTTTLRRETTTTTNKTTQPFSSTSASPSTANKGNIFNQTSAFNVVQPAPNGNAPQRNLSTRSSTTIKSTVTQNSQPQPKPHQQQQQQQPQQQYLFTNISSSRSTSDLPSASGSPLFKPSRFVPGRERKDIPGLYGPGSPMMDTQGNMVFGKENVAPQPQFQVKNIFSDQSRSRSRDIWRPNVWPSEQKPGLSNGKTPTPKEDFSPYNTFPLPKVRQGYSLVQEQKKRLDTQSSRSDLGYDYYDGEFDDDHHHHHHRPSKLHVFAPPVEIHADGVHDSPTSPYITYSASGEPIYMYDYEDGSLSPDSTLRKKNLYSDSAFYDTPGKSYPTIVEQMQLCKKIALSLTSAANRRARGAKMFMRRKRKSGKWVHEGHSEWSSSAGDVANIRELESELSPDEGGTKPLLYFKIPNLKNRVGSKAKQTKMALTQEQFERLRLEAKKCEHKSVAPDTCFGIVADLKAHKGKGGRMFERRRERTDKYVIDENNSRFSQNPKRLEHILGQPLKQDKSPWEAAMQDGNVDAAFSHLSEWERNQRMNTLYQASSPRRAPVVPLAPSVQTAPLPSIHSRNLKSDSSAFMLRGKDFNRVARGWRGGGEYPVAERLQHVSPTRQTGPSSPNSNYNNKIKAWQGSGQSPYSPSAANPLPEPARADRWASRRLDDWQNQQQQQHQQQQQQHQHQASRLEYRPMSAPQNPAPAVRPVSWQSESFHSGLSRDEDYTYAPVDYRYTPEAYPTVAYMQPIIPGTDC